MHLRAVFVDVVKKNKTYRDFIPSCNVDDIEEFRSPGIFESDVGDLVIRVLADILSVPVLIISSSVDNPVKPILPENAVVPFPLYLALDDSSVGHYDATKRRTMERSNLAVN